MLVFFGGGLGSIVRYGISEYVRTKFQLLFHFLLIFSMKLFQLHEVSQTFHQIRLSKQFQNLLVQSPYP